MPPFTLELDLPPGINADDTAFAATGQWADGDNVRFVNGKPQTCGGESAAHFTLAGTAQNCTDLFAILRSGSPSIVYGQSAEIGITTGLLSIAAAQGTNPSAPTARTPASLGTNADTGWCFQAWGEILLASGRGTTVGAAQGGRLYEQTGTSTATHVTQAPARNTCILVTDQRQVLSFGCNEEISGTFNAMCIRGSDLEDYTDWTTTPTNNAFEHILDGGGAIVTAHKVGQYIGVWTTTGLFLGQYIGDPAQTYRFDKVAEECGPYSMRSVVVHKGTAYWMDKTLQFRAWVPGGQVQSIPCSIINDISLGFNVSPFESTSFLVANPLFDELWFFDTTLPGNYIAFCVKESEQAQRPVWFKGDQDRSAVLFSNLLLISGLGAKGQVIHSIEQDGTCMASAYIKSADFYINQAKTRSQIQRCRPDFELLSGNAAALNLIVTTRNYPQSTTITTSTQAITSATTKKDFRVSGMLAAVKLQSTDTDGWRLGKPAFDCVTMGER